MVGLDHHPSYLQRSFSLLTLITDFIGVKMKSCCGSSGPLNVERGG